MKGHEKARLRIGTGWTEVEIRSDPFVVYTRRGYAPVIEVLRSGLPHLLFVSAISLSEQLEAIRERQGSLVGVRMRLRKQDAGQFSPYIVEEL